MSQQTAYQKPEVYVDCPACGEGSFIVGHLPLGKHHASWMCQECGANIEFTRLSETEFDVRDTGKRIARKLVVLESKGPVRLVLDTWNYAGDHPSDYSNDDYFYNEHTCPTNYTPDIVMVINPEDGDTDPHGIFEYVRSGPWHDTEDDGAGWCAAPYMLENKAPQKSLP